MKFQQVTTVCLTWLITATKGFLVSPRGHHSPRGPGFLLRASDVDSSSRIFPTPKKGERDDEGSGENILDAWFQSAVADHGIGANNNKETPFGHVARRDTLAAALLSSGVLASSRGSLSQFMPPGFGLDATNAMPVAESVMKGDAIVRSLWLNRLAYPVLIVSLESGLFEALKNHPLSRPELGRRMTPQLKNPQGRTMEAILAVLSSLQLIRMIDDKMIELTEEARHVLLRDSPYFWGHQLLAADGMTTSLRVALHREDSSHHSSSNSATGAKSYNAKSDATIHSFIDSMQSHSGVTAIATAHALEPFLTQQWQTQHVLDMAGGSGCFSKALHDQTGIPVTLADLPVVVERYHSQHRFHGSGVKAVAADLFDPSTWPTNADCHLMANIVHDWGPSQVLQILQASRQSLNAANSGSTGTLVLIEQLLNDDRSGPLPAALASVSMVLGDWRTGKQYSFEELANYCKQAGFSRVEKGPKIGDFYTAVIAHV